MPTRVGFTAATLVVLLLAGAAHAAPTSVSGSIEFRGTDAIAPFSWEIEWDGLSGVSYGPGNAVSIQTVSWSSFAPLPYQFYGGFENSVVEFNNVDHIRFLDPLAFGPTASGLGGAARLYFSRNVIRDKVGSLGFGNGFVFGTNLTFPVRSPFSPTGWTDRGYAGAWTTKTVTISGSHPVAGPFVTTLAGSDLRTAGGVGTLSLVSPVRLNDEFGTGQDFAFFMVITLEFVPEPAPALLVVAGLGLLGLVALRR